MAAYLLQSGRCLSAMSACSPAGKELKSILADRFAAQVFQSWGSCQRIERESFERVNSIFAQPTFGTQHGRLIDQIGVEQRSRENWPRLRHHAGDTPAGETFHDGCEVKPAAL